MEGSVLMNELELFKARTALIQAYLAENDYDGILLSRIDNFAMATGGKRNYVWMATDMGANSLFVTRKGKVYFVGNNIEKTRQMDEELGPLGCDVRSFLWCENTPAGVISEEFSGNLVSDDGGLGENVNADLAVLRTLLTPGELDKYRELGRCAAESMTAVINAVSEGMAEADIATHLVAEGARRRCLVPVALVAADARIAKYRHPLPTKGPLVSGSLDEHTVNGYVMVVGCFMREGLVVSMTRFKRVADIDGPIMDAYARVCGVDAIMQEATEPGKTLGDVFAVCQRAYVDMGFPENEWHNHHQGGSTGYAGRTCKGAPGETFPVLDSSWESRVKDILDKDISFGAAFAWNPSAAGVKSEDTFILLPDGNKEIVTATPQLPQTDLDTVLGRPTDVIKSDIAT